jgi:ADP-heptose:LPS heptosyltransferase
MDVKRWSPQKFAMLADQICKVFNAQVFIVGGPDESAVKKQVGKSMTEPFDIVEPVSLQKTAALLKHCEFALCNDSGIMHMAACAGVPTAGIFGPTDEKRNGPFGNKTFVVRKQMDGFPLWTAENVGSRKCPRGIDPKASLEALTSDEAWKQLKPWLQKNLHF